MSKTGRLTKMKTQLRTVNSDNEKCRLIDKQHGEYFRSIFVVCVSVHSLNLTRKWMIYILSCEYYY